MKITFPNGRVVERQFDSNNVNGYTAKTIEIGPHDIEAMRLMALRDPTLFDVVMLNLHGRFPGTMPRGKR